MNKITIIIVALIIIGISISLIVSNKNSNMANGMPPSSPSIPTNPVSGIPTTPAPSSVTVSIKDFAFSPSILTIKTGTQVIWMNNDPVPHTVTADSGNLIHSEILRPGQTFNTIFTDIGTTDYHCNIHPGMKGSVIVRN